MQTETAVKKVPGTNGEKKLRKSPIPQSAERITAGAIKLKLTERVELIKVLQETNELEVDVLQKEEYEAKERLEKAKLILNGK